MKKLATFALGAFALVNLSACGIFDDDDDEGVTRTTTTEETSMHTAPSVGVTTQTQTVQPVAY